VFWLVAAPGVDPTAVARGAETLLFRRGIDAFVLGPDALARLNSDHGFPPAKEEDAALRLAALAALIAASGHVVLVIPPSSAGGQARPVAPTGPDFQEIPAESAEVAAARIEAIAATPYRERRSTS
jgi:adenylylsulfate kinase-like enzyme